MDADPNDQAGQTEFYLNWLSGLPEEIRFWRDYLKDAGGPFATDFDFRLRRDTLVKERDHTLAESCEALSLPTVKLLDVGSGPLTNLGKHLTGASLELTPCDPLADAYGWLIDDNKIDPPVRTQFADCENLAHYFPLNSFDAVHCSNALDHSYDPARGIVQMLHVVSTDGFVQLGHWENEAEFENYTGLHQWNFTEREGDFVIWNRRTELSMSKLLGPGVKLTIQRIPVEEANRDWILVQLRKSKESSASDLAADDNLQRKYDALRSRVSGRWSVRNIGKPLGARYHRLLRKTLEKEYRRKSGRFSAFARKG